MTRDLDTAREIKRIEAQYSSAGLFRRYARGRARGFLERQVMTVTGSLALCVLIGVEWGVLVALLALVGELTDVSLLRRWLRQSEQGVNMRKLLRWSTYSAAFQAVTIALCVAIAWFLGPNGETTFFCLAYLSAAAINAGMVKAYHRSAAIIRLFIYAVTCASVFFIDIVVLGDVSLRTTFEMVAAFMMAYMVNVFVAHAHTSFMRNRQNARDLLRRQRIIELGNQELQERQREARMLSMVAKHANDSVVISGPDGRITWVNDAFVRTTGFSLEEAQGQTPGDLLNTPRTDMTEVKRLRASIARAEPYRGELINRCKDGREIWVETNVVPVQNEQGQTEVIVAVERDISQAKEHELAMAAARQEAERGQRAKAEFLATMSHEIRTPMNGVIGMADLLCEAELGKDERLYATTIRSSAQALLKIINDILDLSKLDAGKLSIDPVDFAPGPCILDAVDVLRPRAQDKGLFVDVSFETKLPAKVHGDDGRVRQILINLVGNAVKFTEAGGVSVVARHEDGPDGPRMEIEVKDTGIGIAKDKLDGIFDQFSQADAATTRRFGGTGLGLTISRLLAGQMGGDISVTSVEGEGSCFRVTLQFAPAENKAMPSPQAELDVSLLTGTRVLLAEDNRTNRLLVERYLRDVPIHLESVENGALAVSAVTQHAFDIVLMDMSMPVMDGISATKAIRASDCAQPTIIALTANAFVSDREACLASGMDNFVGKPVRKAELIGALISAVGDRTDNLERDQDMQSTG